MHKSKLAFGADTSTRKVQRSYITTSIKATYSMAMNKITATKARSDCPIHTQHGQAGEAYPPGVILQQIAGSNQARVHIGIVGERHEN
jgi:hypothetical protein